MPMLWFADRSQRLAIFLIELIFAVCVGTTAAAQAAPPMVPVCIPRGTQTNWTGDFGYCKSSYTPPPALCDANCQARRSAWREERAVARREGARVERAYKLNKEAIRYSKTGDWAKALQLCKEAYAADPKALYKENIDIAAYHLSLVNAAAKLPSVQTSISALSATLDQRMASDSASASARIRELHQRGQTLLDSSSSHPAAQGSNMFSIAGSGEKPALATFTLPSAQVNSALQQASSTEKSGTEAKALADGVQNQVDPAIIKAISNCGFDRAPCAQPDPLSHPHPPQTPAASTLANRIPEAGRNDPVIQRRLAEYDHFETHRVEKERERAEVNEKIKSGDPDVDVLKAYAADLANQAAQDEKQKQETQVAIGARMSDLGVGPWIEQAPKEKTQP